MAGATGSCLKSVPHANHPLIDSASKNSTASRARPLHDDALPTFHPTFEAPPALTTDNLHRQSHLRRSSSPTSTTSDSSTTSAASSMFARPQRPHNTASMHGALDTDNHSLDRSSSQHRTPITPHTALSSPPVSALEPVQAAGLLVPQPTVRRVKNRKQLSLTTAAPTVAMAQTRSPPSFASRVVSTTARTVPSLSLPATPMPSLTQTSPDAPSLQHPTQSRRRTPPKLPQLNMAMLSLTRRPSLPVMSGCGSPVGELDPGFSLVRGATPTQSRRSGLTLAPLRIQPSSLTSVHDDSDDHVPRTPAAWQTTHEENGTQEANGLEVYTAGPVCVLHPHLWLYANPTLAQAKTYNVVINVAQEIESPLVEAAENEDAEAIPATPMTRQASMQWDGPRQALRGFPGAMDKAQSAFAPRMLDGVEYVHVPWQHNASLAADLPALTALLDRCLAEKKRVLVHCQQGVSRSASLVIAYIMKHMDKDVNEAYGFVKHKSPWIGPNMTLIYQLCEWGKLLKREREEARQGAALGREGGRRPGSDYYHRHRRSLDLSKLSRGTASHGNLGLEGSARPDEEQKGRTWTSVSAAPVSTTFEQAEAARLPSLAATERSAPNGSLMLPSLANGMDSSMTQSADNTARLSPVQLGKRQRAVSSLLEMQRSRPETQGSCNSDSVLISSSQAQDKKPMMSMPTMATLRDSLTSQNGPQKAPKRSFA